jgi:hypothetical protein
MPDADRSPLTIARGAPTSRRHERRHEPAGQANDRQETAMSTNLSTTLPSPTSATHTRGATHTSRAATRRARACARPWHAPAEQTLLASYLDDDGRGREVIARRGAADSTLVVDRDAATLGDARLVAHLAADEPPQNAATVCDSYLRDLARGAAGCRALSDQDALLAPFVESFESEPSTPAATGGRAPLDGRGRAYSLELVASARSIPELRWWRSPAEHGASGETVSLREAIAALERYEPLCALTGRELRRHEHDPGVSTSVLRAELARVHSSPIVLNRGLREAVLTIVAAEELSMSEIAIRCGRVKRDRRGNEAGETSWLARRLGLAPESGRGAPTPWIHSDVLGLIARQGLSVSPREVEL